RKQPSSTDAAVALGDQTLKDQLQGLARPAIISNTNWTISLVADAAGVDLVANSNSCSRFLPPISPGADEQPPMEADATQPAEDRSSPAAPRRRGQPCRPAASPPPLL
uniref:Sox C-terminal domain-containing protein n=1 Tax=Macrostomum lignano TaxID=282301 RepID=A0A1I8FJH5_9PLAT